MEYISPPDQGQLPKTSLVPNSQQEMAQILPNPPIAPHNSRQPRYGKIAPQLEPDLPHSAHTPLISPPVVDINNELDHANIELDRTLSESI